MFLSRYKLHRLIVVTTLAVLSVAPISAQLLDEAVWFQRPVGQGVYWKYYHFKNLFGSRQSVSYIEVDLSTPNVNLAINYRDSYVGPSPGTGSPLYPRAPTSTLAQGIPGSKAAINGTYFNTASYDSTNPTVPWGGGTTYLKVDGSTIHNFDGTSVNRYLMGILFNSKDDVTVFKRSGAWANRSGSWNNMMISGPILVNNGSIETYAGDNTHANARHPRSAVGKTAVGNKLIMLTVDGRTAESAGMSCTELAQVMKALGCNYAVNLDGGGSTTLWATGEPFSGVVNYPSDNGEFDHLGQRFCANALVVTSTAPVKPAYDARLTGLTYDSLTRSQDVVTVTASYTNIGSATWTSSNVDVVPSRNFGRSSAFIPAGSENNFDVMTPSSVAPGQTATFKLNLKAPVVAANRSYEENFALWNSSTGYFGPADGELKVQTTVRPAITGAPPLLVVQGTSDGPNNQWYLEGLGNWGNSSVGFSAPGVANSGTQRYVSATVTGQHADFRPIFEVRGVYRVDVAFPASSSNINPVHYTVNHLNGSQTATVNQNNSDLANKWQLLGEFPFGTDSIANLGVHSVRVSNNTSTGNRFYSGAIRLDYVGPLADVTDWALY